MIPLFVFIISAQVVTVDVAQDVNILSLETFQQHTTVRLPDCDIASTAGAPEVPVKPLRIALPYGARVIDVNIISRQSELIEGEYLLRHVQEPTIFRQENVKETKPNDEIYASDAPYPGSIVEFKGVHSVDGQSLCELLFYPVQYMPLSGKILFHSSVSISITHDGGAQQYAQSSLIKNMVMNPEDVILAPGAGGEQEFTYLIITNPPMDTIFQRLADWKTKKGIKTEVRTVDWILSQYTGEDDAACVRNYIKTVVDSGVHYVCLGGDVDVVPHRRAYAMTCEWGGHFREDSLPCDLYYADLQGSWDRDNDGTYGEIEDSINLYPDIAIGRAPVNTVAEAQKFVEKVLVYEKDPTLGYQDNAQFAADILWSVPHTDMAIHKNNIEDESCPSYFEINKLYQSMGNVSPTAFLEGMLDGQHLMNHDGHGSTGSMTVGGFSSLHNADFDTITNAPLYGILISIGCWTAAFDYNSIGESFVNSPNGGGVAFIGNSSYGWGAPGNPGFGYSDRYDSRFFYSLLQENNYHLGDALAQAKAHFVPYSREENVYRWIQYQLNLLGDPEMPVWTAAPESLSVSYPQSVPVGNSRILITVLNKENGQPVRNALVCIMKGSESYAADYTDAGGAVFLDVSPATTGSCDLTVTCHNYLPVETTIPVTSGAYVNFMGWNVYDAFGNNDGIANPNEYIFLDVVLKNTGDESAHTIGLLLRSSDSLVRIDDSVAIVPTLDPGDSVLLKEALEVFTRDAPNGYGIHFQVHITYNGDTLTNYPMLLIGTPDIDINEVIVIEPPSLPDESESLYVRLQNNGFGCGHACFAVLTSNDPYVSVIDDSVWYGMVFPESQSLASEPFMISIGSDCPSPYLAKLPLAIYTNDYTFADTVTVLIGETGFVDDMESGDTLWTTGGVDNLWHISTQSAHSPSHAWYCGDTTTMQYHDTMDCYIQTIPFLLHASSKLSFYRWFDVPIYGSDGICVIVMGDSFSDTLDFIGTGGALGTKNIQSDWFREEYSLANYTAGDSIQIRIAFTSDGDGDIGQGFFIDDVKVVAQEEADPSPPYIIARKVDNDVQLSWQPVTTDTLGNTEIVDYYVVYRGTTLDFVPHLTDSIGSVQYPDTAFTDSGVLLEHQSYYYLVMAADVTQKHSAKSNMAYLLCRNINENASTTDKSCVSIPWHSEYVTASGVTDDLSPYGDPLNKITTVQQNAQYQSWVWDDLFMEWTGTDFNIAPGRAYEMNAVRNTMLLLVGSNNPEGTVALYDNPYGADKNWTSIPYNAVYDVVSSITDEYCPGGDPVTKITRLRGDQLFESWLWDDLFMEWAGSNFAITPGYGYDFSVNNDTTWNPTEFANDGSKDMTYCRAQTVENHTRLGESTESDRGPVWRMVDGIPVCADAQRDARFFKSNRRFDEKTAMAHSVERSAFSHIIRCHLYATACEDIAFTVYRPRKPADVLTEKMIGSGILQKGNEVALWCDAGNFSEPWHTGEETIIIIEVLCEGTAFFAAVCFTINEQDIQELYDVALEPFPEPRNENATVQWPASSNNNVIGYSVYDHDRRLNAHVVKTNQYETPARVDIRLVMRGGFETVYSSSGTQSQNEPAIPLHYALTVFPNPCLKNTWIHYALPRAAPVDITIYDVSGRKVRTLVSGTHEAGYYTALWDGIDNQGRTVSSGIYFVQCISEEFTEDIKVLMIK